MPDDSRSRDRRRGVVAALDSSLLVAMPVTCGLLALALGWTYAYLPRLPLLVGALCFAGAAATAVVGLRGGETPRTPWWLGASVALVAVALAMVVVGAR